jgi:hypothetical protein
MVEDGGEVGEAGGLDNNALEVALLIVGAYNTSAVSDTE